MPTFNLSIDLGNEAMQTRSHVATALNHVARGMREDSTWEGSIIDGNGNKVGTFERTEPRDDGLQSFTVVGVYEDAEGEDGKPQRFADTVTATSVEDAERYMVRECPGLIVAGVVVVEQGELRMADL